MTELSRAKDGREWRIGGDTDVAWIANGTTRGLAITSGIPPLFEAYATLELAGTPNGRGGWAQDEEDLREQPDQDSRVLLMLQEHTAPQSWWLGYLDTGSADTIFPDAPMVSLYAAWNYVLIEAGPEQAGRWCHQSGRTRRSRRTRLKRRSSGASAADRGVPTCGDPAIQCA